MLNCRETSQLVSESLDRTLTFRERIAVRLHLLLCKACERFVRQVKLLSRALRAASDEDLTRSDVRMGDATRHRIRERLKFLP